MLVSDLITRVRNSAGDINVLQFTDDMLLTWINDGIREVAIQNHLLQKTGTQSTVADQQDYPLPEDILKLHSVQINNERIQVLTLQEWEALYAGEISGEGYGDRGRPYKCYVWANTLKLWPVPDTSYQLVINYIYDHEDVTSSATDLKTILPVGYHLRLFSYCMAQVALQDDDVYKYNAFMQEFLTGVREQQEMQKQQEDLYPFGSVAARDMGGFEYGELGYW